MSIDNAAARNLVNEVDEIVENLKGIKGETYTTGLLLIINIINLNRVTSAMLAPRIEKEEQERLETISNATINDSILRVAELMNPSSSSASHHLLCTALSKDCQILLAKQSEYSTKEAPNES